MKKLYIIFLTYSILIDIILLRYGKVLGTLADESREFQSNVDTIILFSMFILTLILQIWSILQLGKKFDGNPEVN
jgi:hypothetical protein